MEKNSSEEILVSNNNQFSILNKRSSLIKDVIFFVILLILVIVIFSFFLLTKKNNTPVKNNITNVAKINTPEIIQKSIKNLTKEYFIYHEKTNEYSDDFKTPVITELWTDSDSSRFIKKVVNQDEVEIWQGFDGNIYWQQDFNEKTFLRQPVKENDDLAVNYDGQKIELISNLKNMLEDGRLKTVEETRNGKKVFVVNDAENEEYWSVLIFDKQTLKLILTEKYEKVGGVKKLSSRIDYISQEFIERNDENIVRIFNYIIPEGFKIIDFTDATESASLNN